MWGGLSNINPDGSAEGPVRQNKKERKKLPVPRLRENLGTLGMETLEWLEPPRP